MSEQESIPAQRERLIHRIFGGPVPPLWCPALTHYGLDGAIDEVRMAAHLGQMAIDVGGWLMPGSTGDGWELSEEETDAVTEFALAQGAKFKRPILIGVLQPDASEALKRILKWVLRFRQRTGKADELDALLAVGACGFAVCPPRGENRTQNEMEAALTAILETRLPVALYQLPQVTGNEMSPELVSELASRFPNFLLFKDSSGKDRVALSGQPVHGAFMMRGAESDYARWHKSSGGPYQGYLLSTANCFAKELNEMIGHLNAGRKDAASEISGRVAAAVGEVFGLVQALPRGNAFANANKAMDHFMAHGPNAGQVPPPRLHSGEVLPQDVIARTGDALKRRGLLPTSGYLHN